MSEYDGNTTPGQYGPGYAHGGAGSANDGYTNEYDGSAAAVIPGGEYDWNPAPDDANGAGPASAARAVGYLDRIVVRPTNTINTLPFGARPEALARACAPPRAHVARSRVV